jgi:hypothetical protein
VLLLASRSIFISEHNVDTDFSINERVVCWDINVVRKKRTSDSNDCNLGDDMPTLYAHMVTAGSDL